MHPKRHQTAEELLRYNIVAQQKEQLAMPMGSCPSWHHLYPSWHHYMWPIWEKWFTCWKFL